MIQKQSDLNKIKKNEPKPQSEAFQLVRGRLACLPPQTKQDKQREARRCAASLST